MTLHKPKGLARVRLDGRDIYLGPWGTPEAEAEYRRVIAEWLSSGVAPPVHRRSTLGTVTVGDLARAYKPDIEPQVSSRVYKGTIRPSLVRLDRLYGHTPANDFSPASLEALLGACADELLRSGRHMSRGYINQKILPCIQRLFRWGVRKGLVEARVWQALCAVEPVKRGFRNVVERAPVGPVPDQIVEATLPHLPENVADMVRMQRLTGMRPGEVCALNWAEIDRSGTVWMFKPREHKTAHRGKVRDVAIGPKAQAVLMKYLKRTPGRIFSPALSEAQRRDAASNARKSKPTPRQLAERAHRREHPCRTFKDHYTARSYGLAVARAAKRAFRPKDLSESDFNSWRCPQHWHPNQLRHTRATEIRSSFGLDAAGAVLGHAKLETTQVYAERNAAMAVRVALATG